MHFYVVKIWLSLIRALKPTKAASFTIRCASIILILAQNALFKKFLSYNLKCGYKYVDMLHT